MSRNYKIIGGYKNVRPREYRLFGCKILFPKFRYRFCISACWILVFCATTCFPCRDPNYLTLGSLPLGRMQRCTRIPWNIFGPFLPAPWDSNMLCYSACFEIITGISHKQQVSLTIPAVLPNHSDDGNEEDVSVSW